jgi:hypothetical protein
MFCWRPSSVTPGLWGPRSGLRLRRIKARCVQSLNHFSIAKTDCGCGREGYDLELRINNLQMDMTGVELSVVNAHQQVQCVEDEVIPKFNNKQRRAINNFHEAQEDLEKKFNDRCDQIQHSYVVVMDSFICLEKGIKENTDQIVQLDNNQQ